MKVIVPIAGLSPFFKSEEYAFPKPLIEVGGKPMIELVVENLKRLVPDPELVFVAQERDLLEGALKGSLYQVCEPKPEIFSLKGKTSGALVSCLLAIDYITPEEPLLISNGDQVIGGKNASDILTSWINSEVQAGVIAFNSIHPRWSYAIIDRLGHVQQTAEKNVISKNAIAGFYYFAKGQYFIDAAMSVIEGDVRDKGQFFISSTLNEIILKGGIVQSAFIDSTDYHSFYSPQKISEYEKELQVSELSEAVKDSSHRVNVVIPAAGEGSRFAKAGYTTPKPFISVEDKPMVARVISNLNLKDADYSILLRDSHIGQQVDTVADLKAQGCKIVNVSKLTEGTACTILLARGIIDHEAPLLIANSDQLVDFDCQKFVDDCLSRGLDGSILVFRDDAMDPKWSFAKVDELGLVTEVAEKQPISNLATVGIYLFSSGKQFVDAAIDMIANNDRVNNEFYTCPVYNYLVRNGARIGVYEVSKDSMHGLGTPSDLTTYLEQRK